MMLLLLVYKYWYISFISDLAVVSAYIALFQNWYMLYNLIGI